MNFPTGTINLLLYYSAWQLSQSKHDKSLITKVLNSAIPTPLFQRFNGSTVKNDEK